MKKKIFAAVEVFIATMAVLATVTAFGAAGSENDPLVSKSYVDDKINQILEIINGGAVNVTSDGNAATQVTPAASAASYAPVYASVGQVVLGGEGTEMILRSGKGDIYITGADGIVDSTTGQNLKNGDKAAVNHTMIVPRGDGRGVKVTEAAWFLIKGEYTIE